MRSTERIILIAILAILLIGLIVLFFYYELSTEVEQNDKNFASEEELKEAKELQMKNNFSEEESQSDYSDCDKYYFMDVVRYPFGDFDRKLAHIVDQVDDYTFQARFCETDSIVTCYLSDKLLDNNIQPLVGGLVRLEYLEYYTGLRSRIYYIIQVINSKIREGPPWVWYMVRAEIIEEDEEMYGDERLLYAMLESEQLVLCKVKDYFLDTFFYPGDIVLLEVNETNRSFYYIFEIMDP
jgi:hypothetical protein